MKKRYIIDKILNQKNIRKVSILIGARQVGKTTILKNLHKQLGGLFLDLDILSNYERINSYEKFINTLKIEGYKESSKKFFYVFLDEFQNYANITKIIKNVYDNHNNIKIFATGSSSLNIKTAIQESLAGRKIINYIYPLSFEEFLIFKEREEIVSKIKIIETIKSKNYFSLIPEIELLFEEFLIFGAYPEIALLNNRDAKVEALTNIFDLYVRKDLINYLKIEKIQNTKTLISLLAVNNGQIVNYAKLSAKTNMDAKTVKNYIEVLKETFLINVIKPFYRNKNCEVSKAPKIYFLDNGVKNYFLNNFNNLNLRNDTGWLFESYYISRLLKYGEKPENIKYYRTKNKIEIDIVLDYTSKIVPIELKFKKEKISKKNTLALKNFIEKYNLPKAYLISLAESGIKDDKIEKSNCFKIIQQTKKI